MYERFSKVLVQFPLSKYTITNYDWRYNKFDGNIFQLFSLEFLGFIVLQMYLNLRK